MNWLIDINIKALFFFFKVSIKPLVYRLAPIIQTSQIRTVNKLDPSQADEIRLARQKMLDCILYAN